jgi:carboxypeptidase D
MSTTTNEDFSSELPSSADFLIDALPGQPKSTTQSIIQYAGHLPSHPPSTLSPPPDSHLWFWLIRSKHIADREKYFPTRIFWLNYASVKPRVVELGSSFSFE